MAQIDQLSLWNFRNYSKANLTLSPKINIFIGKNGQGKTNCLEAIGLLFTGKSFRTSLLKEAILHQESHFSVQARFQRHSIDQSLTLDYAARKRQLKHNDTTYTSFAPLIGLIQGVFFSGFQNQLIKGAPSLRRRFLDVQSAQLDPLYLHHLRRYQHALKERNACLRTKQIKSLEFYEELMAQSAPYLVEQRLLAIEELEVLAQTKHAQLTGQNEAFTLLYQMHPALSKAPTSLEFLNLFKSERSRDIKSGFTTLGPHRDDLLFFLNKYEARKYASEGQIQSLITALYLAEYQRIWEKSQEPPLFCIDDIGQNLDKSRLEKLYQLLDQMGQVFITTPKKLDYHFKSAVKSFNIVNGNVLRAQEQSALF
ncbi:MAG: DNA replication and repair protein RecF [Chlamydiae bacterium]|nr:DNA replication and repair protein RecF [Chlamydiota bacterium]